MADLPPTYHQFKIKENEPLQSDLQRLFMLFRIVVLLKKQAVDYNENNRFVTFVFREKVGSGVR